MAFWLNNASSTSSLQEIRFLCSWVRSNQWISTTRWRESLYTSLRASLTKECILRLKISYLNILVSSIPVVPRRKIVLEQPHCTVYMAVDHCLYSILWWPVWLDAIFAYWAHSYWGPLIAWQLTLLTLQVLWLADQLPLRVDSGVILALKARLTKCFNHCWLIAGLSNDFLHD